MERHYVMILFALALGKPDILPRPEVRTLHNPDEFAASKFQGRGRRLDGLALVSLQILGKFFLNERSVPFDHLDGALRCAQIMLFKL